MATCGSRLACLTEAQQLARQEASSLQETPWTGTAFALPSSKSVPKQLTLMQVEEPLYFVDFLREPIVDNDTGEVRPPPRTHMLMQPCSVYHRPEACLQSCSSGRRAAYSKYAPFSCLTPLASCAVAGD